MRVEGCPSGEKGFSALQSHAQSSSNPKCSQWDGAEQAGVQHGAGQTKLGAHRVACPGSVGRESQEQSQTASKSF